MTPRSILQLTNPHAYLMGGTHRLSDMLAYAIDTRPDDEVLSLYHDAARLLLGVRSAFSYGSGRAALMEILKAIEVKQGDEVIVPGYTCIVTPAAVIALGAKPVYADIDVDTLNISPAAVEKLVSSKTRAVLAQHTFGIPCNVKALEAIAVRHGIHLIEDCAHAFGAKIGEVYCGNFGSAAFFSTEQTKMISTVKGGVAVTNNLRTARRLEQSYQGLPTDDFERVAAAVTRWGRRTLETHERLGALFAFATRLARRLGSVSTALGRAESFDEDEYRAALDGIVRRPTRLSAQLARIGLRQLGRLENDVRMRNKVAGQLLEVTASLGWKTPAIDWVNTRPSFVRFPALVEDRRYWLDLLGRNGIDAGVWLDHPLHPAGSNYGACGYATGMCPNAESVSSQIINVPLHPRCCAWIVQRLRDLSYIDRLA